MSRSRSRKSKKPSSFFWHRPFFASTRVVPTWEFFWDGEVMWHLTERPCEKCGEESLLWKECWFQEPEILLTNYSKIEITWQHL